MCGDKTHHARDCPKSPVNKRRAPQFGIQHTQNRAGCITLCSVTEVSNRYDDLKSDGEEEEEMPPLTDSQSETERPFTPARTRRWKRRTQRCGCKKQAPTLCGAADPGSRSPTARDPGDAATDIRAGILDIVLED